MARRKVHRPVSQWRPPAAGARRSGRAHRNGVVTAGAARSVPLVPTTVRPGYHRPARVIALVVAFVYLIAISAWLLTHGGWPTPDYLIPPLLLVAIALGRGWPFVFDWGPFLLLVLSWQATAGVADQFGGTVHVSQIVDAEMWLWGGRIPTVELQDRLFDPARAHWYDWAGTVQHALHFVLPVVVGLVIWLRGRRLYWRYLASLMTLFYLGFAGYVLYPTAPPWMAGMQDMIPPVHRIAVETVLRLPSSAPIGLAYTHFSANQVAAMPSLHAAVPLLLALVLVRLWGWRALPALVYPLAMGFNLVYLGEHYSLDVLAGYGVALVAYGLVWVLPDVLPFQVVRRPARARAWSRPVPAGARAGSGAPASPGRGAPALAWARRSASAASLWGLAAVSLVVVLGTLRPDRAQTAAGPVVPGLQVQAGQARLLEPVACAEGASPSLTAGNYLVPVTGSFAVYLFDLDTADCFSLSSNLSFPPPRVERLPALAARVPVRLAPVPRSRQGVQHIALRAGPPAPALLDAGLPPDHRFLLVVELADVTDLDAAAAAIDDLAAITLLDEPGPPPPEPIMEGADPPPSAVPPPAPPPTLPSLPDAPPAAQPPADGDAGDGR